jgi:hypothetical protein
VRSCRPIAVTALFTEQELAAALGFMGSRENAGKVGRAIDAMSVEAQMHYDSIDSLADVAGVPVAGLLCSSKREFAGEAREEQRKAFRAGVEEMRGPVGAHRTPCPRFRMKSTV